MCSGWDDNRGGDDEKMKYIAHCVPVMGGYALEIIEVEENEIYDSEEEARKRNRWACR